MGRRTHTWVDVRTRRHFISHTHFHSHTLSHIWTPMGASIGRGRSPSPPGLASILICMASLGSLRSSILPPQAHHQWATTSDASQILLSGRLWGGSSRVVPSSRSVMQAMHAILKFSSSYITNGKSRGTWVAQAVGRPTLGIDSGLGL